MPGLVTSRQFSNQSPLTAGVNRLNQPLYDRVNVPTTIPTAAIPFFTIPAGGSATIIRGSTATAYTKTRRDTNMDIGGQSPQKAFLIVGMSIDFIPISPAAATATGAFVTQDIMTLKNGLWFQFKIVDTLVVEGPVKMIPALDPFVATTLNASLASGTNSQGGVPMYKFPEAVLLPPTTNFVATMTFDPPTSAIALNQTFDILWTFHALLERNG
jgi:hypothetical protein